jgi:hypothetical protein
VIQRGCDLNRRCTSHTPAAPGVYYYNDTETGSKFILDTHPSSYDDAAAACRKYGAQPVAFDSYDEQYNAETYYIEELVCGRCWAEKLAVAALLNSTRC